jgi:hypothetical protein
LTSFDHLLLLEYLLYGMKKTHTLTITLFMFSISVLTSDMT